MRRRRFRRIIVVITESSWRVRWERMHGYRSWKRSQRSCRNESFDDAGDCSADLSALPVEHDRGARGFAEGGGVDGVRVQYVLLYVAQHGAGGEHESGQVSGGVSAGTGEPAKTRGGAIDSAASANQALGQERRNRCQLHFTDPHSG